MSRGLRPAFADRIVSGTCALTPHTSISNQLQESTMKTDAQLQQDVMAELKWEPTLSAAQIGVSAKDGVITLTGAVDGYAKKSEAEDAVKRVAGVTAVVEKIEVKYPSDWAKKDDNDIAAEVVNAFKWNWEVPSGKVKAKVENGWVTLEGELAWKFQSDAATTAVKSLLGVAGVSNNIKIKPQTDDALEKADIESALERNWSVSDQDIQVKVSGHKATLTGTVDSWYQKDEASRIAWNAPGVWNVENELLVEYD
jgi:osmotically-inducible protein OsmY